MFNPSDYYTYTATAADATLKSQLTMYSGPGRSPWHLVG
jgi:hypothetical protein